MKTGPAGIELITTFEKLVTSAYLQTDKDIWTIGYGHTRGVKVGDTCTVNQAHDWLSEDLAEAERAVNGIGVRLSQGQFDALVSLVFACGPRPLMKGATIGDGIRSRDWYAAAAGFFRWRKQAGTDVRGLARRRAQEMVLFLSDPFPVG